MTQFTVIGGTGFIGNEIVQQLKLLGHQVWVPQRDDAGLFERPLGIVLYCAGYGDCQKAPFAVLEANTSLLAKVLESSQFDRLVYISSTRVYMNHQVSTEDTDLTVCKDDSRRLFNLSKLVSEELCLRSGRPVTIARPSNVYGLALNSPLFLPSITRNAIHDGRVDMFVAPGYAKDYVSVHDVATAIIKLSTIEAALGEIYNIAAGYNVTAAEIASVLQQQTGCEVIWHQIQFPRENFPITSVSKIFSVFNNYSPRNVLSDMKKMIQDYKDSVKNDAE